MTVDQTVEGGASKCRLSRSRLSIASLTHHVSVSVSVSVAITHHISGHPSCSGPHLAQPRATAWPLAGAEFSPAAATNFEGPGQNYGHSATNRHSLGGALTLHFPLALPLN